MSRCHDCYCHLSPPCDRCVDCAHSGAEDRDIADCPNDCQECEDHRLPGSDQAPDSFTTATLYRPMLIESAEQAHALPVGTVATHPDYWPREKGNLLGSWEGPGDAMQNAEMVGWTALVPIEAEEETREHPRRHEKAPRTGEAYLRPATMTRLVTPWEEA